MCQGLQTKTNSRVKKLTLSNTTLCHEMRPFGTLAEVMRIKKIARVVIISNCAEMTLEELVEGSKDGVLHLGESIKIRSQDQYEKYCRMIHRHLPEPWTFEDVRTETQKITQRLFKTGMIPAPTSVSEM